MSYVRNNPEFSKHWETSSVVKVGASGGPIEDPSELRDGLNRDGGFTGFDETLGPDVDHPFVEIHIRPQ